MTFEPMWGLTGTLEQRLRGIKQRGYDGVEVGLPEFMARLGDIQPEEVPDFPHLLRDLDLGYLPMIFTYEPEFSARWGGMAIEADATHASTFQQQVEAAAEYEPLQMTSHSGSDAMTLGEAVEFFETALKVESEVGVPIGHETHRMRILYSPFVWRDVHRELPEFRTVADISHWVNVCERIPDDLDDIFSSLAASAIHIHGRVGHPEAPQVTDPRAPENEQFVRWHEQWWRKDPRASPPVRRRRRDVRSGVRPSSVPAFPALHQYAGHGPAGDQALGARSRSRDLGRTHDLTHALGSARCCRRRSRPADHDQLASGRRPLTFAGAGADMEESGASEIRGASEISGV